MKANSRIGVGIAATFGLAVLLVGLTGATPAMAADRGDHIYRDVQDVRRDESRLSDLEDRRDEARRCHHWSEARALDREISDLRRHIDRDRRDIRQDINRDRQARYQDDYRNRDSSRYSDSSRYRVNSRYQDDTRYREAFRYRDRYDRSDSDL